jgi:hypothetical protein
MAEEVVVALQAVEVVARLPLVDCIGSFTLVQKRQRVVLKRQRVQYNNATQNNRLNCLVNLYGLNSLQHVEDFSLLSNSFLRCQSPHCCLHPPLNLSP